MSNPTRCLLRACFLIAGVALFVPFSAIASAPAPETLGSVEVRVLDSSGGSRLVALSPDGRMLTTGSAAELVAAIKSKF